MHERIRPASHAQRNADSGQIHWKSAAFLKEGTGRVLDNPEPTCYTSGEVATLGGRISVNLPFGTSDQERAALEALAHFRDDLSHLPATADKRYEFVFGEVRHALDLQASVLDNLRARAQVLLSTATVAVTFVAALGLLTERTKPLPIWADILLIADLMAVGFCAFAILWPRSGWYFSIGPQISIEDYIEAADPNSQNPNVIYRKLALFLWARWRGNATKLDGLFLFFRLGTGLLLAGVVILLLGLAGR